MKIIFNPVGQSRGCSDIAAQTSGLTYHRSATCGISDVFRRSSQVGGAGRLQAGDTADHRSALQGRMRRIPTLVLLLFLVWPASAYPPAPHHTLYGALRNQWGDPIITSPGNVILETPTGVQLRASIGSDMEPGVNYRLEVPMDSGTASDLYKPTALKPFFQFKLKVQIGQTTYLPIEMSGNFSQIGQPSQKTRIDLTLGVDSDGDGLPDAWEQTLIDIYGGTLGSINPNGDNDGDGIPNLDEYLAGTYAFDPSDGFRLTVTGAEAGASDLEFLAIRGRTYSIQSSPNFQQWTQVNFGVLTGNVPGALQSNYRATDVRMVKVRVPDQPGVTNRYFRALVQ